MIDEFIKKKGLTHRDFAKLADIPSNSIVSNLVHGYYQGTPALKTLAAIATNILNVEIGEFISYLYDEQEELLVQTIPVSLIEIGIKQIEDTEQLIRVLESTSSKIAIKLAQMEEEKQKRLQQRAEEEDFDFQL